MLGDVVLNPTIPDICRKFPLPQSFFSGADEGGSMVVSKQELFNCKVSTASISGPVALLDLEIELVVGFNASLDDGPDETTSSQVARVKGSCLLQLLVCGVLVNVSWLMIGARLIIS